MKYFNFKIIYGLETLPSETVIIGINKSFGNDTASCKRARDEA